MTQLGGVLGTVGDGKGIRVGKGPENIKRR
jgi:hypothetical protein